MIEIQKSSGTTENINFKIQRENTARMHKLLFIKKRSRRGKPERPEGASGKPESSRAIHQQEAGKTTNKHDRRRTGKRGTGTQGERTTTADRNTDTGPPTQEVPLTPPNASGALCGEAGHGTNRRRRQDNRRKRGRALND